MALSFDHGSITVSAKGVRAEASRAGVVVHSTEGKTREEAVALMRQWLTQFPLPVAEVKPAIIAEPEIIVEPVVESSIELRVEEPVEVVAEVRRSRSKRK